MAARLARLGLLTALALALSGLERLLPAPSALPGIKLGLGNLAVVIALYRYGAQGRAAGFRGAHFAFFLFIFHAVWRALFARGRALRPGGDGASLPLPRF